MTATDRGGAPAPSSAYVPPSRIVVLDNGLRSAGEHSYAIARGLKPELESMGCGVAIYAFQGVEAELQTELGIVPHFTYGLYEGRAATASEQRWRNRIRRLTFRPLDYGPSERESARVFNRAFADDLARLPAETWARGTLVLFPGLMQHQIVGLADFLRATPVAAKVVCQLMFEPSWLPWDRRARRGGALYRRAFGRLKPLIGRTIVFTAENAPTADLYRRRFGLPDVPLLPVPLARGPAGATRDRLTRLGFLGYSKAEKGFHLLPAAIRACLVARPALRFTIQVQHHGQEPAVVEAERELRMIPQVRILEGPLSSADFARESAQLDMMLLPYDPRRFGMRGSGLFVEAVTSGQIVVASEETWAGRSVARGDATGTAFRPYTSAALAAAILAECARMPGRRDDAIAKAAMAARTHTIASYVAHLCAAADLPLKDTEKL